MTWTGEVQWEAEAEKLFLVVGKCQGEWLSVH